MCLKHIHSMGGDMTIHFKPISKTSMVRYDCLKVKTMWRIYLNANVSVMLAALLQSRRLKMAEKSGFCR